MRSGGSGTRLANVLVNEGGRWLNGYSLPDFGATRMASLCARLESCPQQATALIAELRDVHEQVRNRLASIAAATRSN